MGGLAELRGQHVVIVAGLDSAYSRDDSLALSFVARARAGIPFALGPRSAISVSAGANLTRHAATGPGVALLFARRAFARAPVVGWCVGARISSIPSTFRVSGGGLHQHVDLALDPPQLVIQGLIFFRLGPVNFRARRQGGQGPSRLFGQPTIEAIEKSFAAELPYGSTFLQNLFLELSDELRVLIDLIFG